jgi:DNA polymerase-3 subunit epsilon/CBS domain-containing protein
MAIDMAEILDEAGVAFCKGGVMAKNAQWRHSVEGWMRTVDGWIGRQSAQDLLNVDIFFDGVAVHGDVALAEEVFSFAHDRAQQAPDFIKMLSVAALDWHPPLTMFGNIRTDDSGRADLKKGGLMPIVIAGRALSIRHGLRARGTAERLRGVAELGIGSVQETEDVVGAHRIILGTILAQQLRDATAGIPLSSSVDIRRLARVQVAVLRHAVGRAASAVDMLDAGGA